MYFLANKETHVRQTIGIIGRERTAIIKNERLGHATSEVVPSSKEFGVNKLGSRDFHVFYCKS